MQAGNIVRVTSLKATHFTDALATNAGEYEDVQLPEGIAAGRHCRCRLRQIQVVSTENLDWEIWLLSKTGGTTADADTDPLLGFWSFVAADAKRVAGAGLFHYYIDGLDVPYEDMDRGAGVAGTGGYLHTCLVNRSAAGKTAGAGGALTVRWGVEMTLGF